MLKKIPLGKRNVTKNALFFLSRGPNHQILTFNSRFLYKLKYKVHSVPLLVKFMLLFNKKHGLFDVKTS